MTSAKELRKIAEENREKFYKFQNEKEEKEAPAEVEKIIKQCTEAARRGDFSLYIDKDNPTANITRAVVKILKNKGYEVWDRTGNNSSWIIRW
jgi:Skp family chaperone for outer membrane proteins